MVYLRCALGKPVHRATMYNDIRVVSCWHPGCVEPIFRAKLDCHLSGEPVLECSLVSTSLTTHEMTRKVSLCKGEKGWGQTWSRRIMCNFRWILLYMTAPKIKKLWKRTKKNTWKHTICPFAGNFPSMLAPPLKHLKKPWFTGTSASTLHWVPPASVCGAARTPRCCPGKSRQNSTKCQPKLTSQLQNSL